MNRTLADSLRRLREDRGLTQVQLAKAIGVERYTIIRMEQGQCGPTLMAFAKICQFLKADMQKVWDGK